MRPENKQSAITGDEHFALVLITRQDLMEAVITEMSGLGYVTVGPQETHDFLLSVGVCVDCNASI